MKKCSVIMGLILVLCLATLAQADVFVGDKGTGMIWQYNNAGGAKTLFADVTLNGLSSPTHMDVVGDLLYINTASGVAYYNLITKAYVGMATSVGRNAMAVDTVNKVLFTASGNTIYATDISGSTAGAAAQIATTPDTAVALTAAPEANGNVIAYVDVSGADRFKEYTATGTFVHDHTYGIANYEGKQDLTYTVGRAVYIRGSDGGTGGSGLTLTMNIVGGASANLVIDSRAAYWGAVSTALDGTTAFYAVNPAAGGHEIWSIADDTFTQTLFISDNSMSQVWGIAFYNPVPVPEPATMSLLVIGGVAALIRRRKK
ncbi:MAG: PEP-CTERM sorting domain-containing protein [Planctomycetaceae bacterium]